LVGGDFVDIKRLNHVHITIPLGSEDQARSFYCGLLGLAEIEKPEALKANGGLWLLCGDMPIHLGIQEDMQRINSKAHLAYEVPDLDAVRQFLEMHGYGITYPTQFPGYRRFETRDPFGNRLEFIQPIFVE
jgi:catechol 2,3-dioxygenase-like lactoylglutathione lyase family enzyme